MRGLKSTSLLGVVLVALAAYIFLVENKKPADGPKKSKAWGIEGSTIVDVTIHLATGDTTRLQKNNGVWSVVEPVRATADEAVIASIVNGLAGLDIERVLEESPAGLKDFGLEPARVEVTFKTGGDPAEKRLRLGEKTPGSGEIYAQTDRSKAVVLVASFLENSFTKGTFELREKSILKFDRTKADGLEIAYGTATLAFAKSGDVDWSMSKPFAARGEFAAIDGAISALASTQVQKFIVDDDRNTTPRGADTGALTPTVKGEGKGQTLTGGRKDGDARYPRDLKRYGLDKPEMTVTLKSEGTTQTLTIGGAVDGTRYATRSSSPGIFTVGNNLLTDLRKGADEFRRKDLFDFRAFTAKRIEVARGTDTLVLEKVKGKDTTTPDNWKSGSGTTTDAMKAEDPLLKVTSLRADTFVPAVPAAFKTPTAVVTAKFDDSKKTEVVKVFVKDADVFATREGEPGAAKITRTAWDEALKALDSLK